jgi:DNA-binding helix-hairpin-helix protein with protein kinase domain
MLYAPVCALLALSLLLSASFVFAERHHHCEGENCPICAAIRQTVLYLAAESAVIARTQRVQVAARPAESRRYSVPAAVVFARSPVSLRVKLSRLRKRCIIRHPFPNSTFGG